MNAYTPKQVQEARRDLEEYKSQQKTGKNGHMSFTYDEAVGLQIMQRDYDVTCELTVINGGGTPKLKEYAKLPVKRLNEDKAA